MDKGLRRQGNFGLSDLKVLVGVVFLGLVARLGALPFSMTTEQDAATRVSLALHWLEDPHWILDGIWLPLQTYYTAIAIGLTQEWVLTPIILNILFSVITAVPLYFFTRQEFEIPTGGRGLAGFVAAAFVLYPIAFRNSLMALSDTPFTFFVVVSLWALSRARQPQASEGYAIVAGLSMTLAAALRYEGWLLIPPLAIALRHKPRQMLVFAGLAFLTPLVWIAGNQVIRGDGLYSFKYQIQDTANVLAERGGMSPLKRFVRTLFIPSVWAWGMTLPFFVLGFWGAAKSVMHRSQAVIWLLPLGILLGLLCHKSISGTLNLQPRYSLLLGTLLMPFSGVALASFRSAGWRRGIGGVSLLLMLPLSYGLHLTRPFLNWALSDTQQVKREIPASLLEAVPRLAPSTETLIEQVKHHLRPEEALFLLNLPEAGYLVLYPLGLPLAQVEILPSGIEDSRSHQKAHLFLRRQPQGLLLVGHPTFPKHHPSRWHPTPDLSVNLQPIESVQDVVLYRYAVLEP